MGFKKFLLILPQINVGYKEGINIKKLNSKKYLENNLIFTKFIYYVGRFRIYKTIQFGIL